MIPPDHPSVLDANLVTIAQLANSQGAKLSFDKTTGRFSIQKKGVGQSLARTFSRDSVESEAFFGQPIREVFATAYPRRASDAGRYNNALAGLRALRGSYAGEKRDALDRVIEGAELGLRRQDSQAEIRLRRKYEPYAVYGFPQGMFLPGNNPGVCYSFAIDWARRILRGKGTFLARKHGPPEVMSYTLNAQQKRRMMKKVDSRIRTLQEELGQYQVSNFGKVLRNLPFDPQVDARVREKYGNVDVFPCDNQPRPIDASATGSKVLASVVLAAKQNWPHTTIFLLKFKTKGTAGGHAIGLHLPQGGTFHFFDPNIGEFLFTPEHRDDRIRFLDEWWSLFYLERERGNAAAQHFESWRIDGVSIAA